MLTRRQFLRSASAAGLAMAASNHTYAASARPPNVIFILADDLGWGDLRCYGSTVSQTPNLDGVARGGIRFANFYVNNPVCSPTRAAFMTGRFPSELGIHAHFATAEQNEKRGMPQALDPATPTLADTLKATGYATGHFGKWHLGDVPPSEYGFDERRVYNLGGKSDWGEDRSFWRRSSELIADEAIRFIEKHREGPFYINVWSHATHAPLDPSEEQMAPFHDARRSDRLTGKFTTPHEVYHAALAELDRNIGRILQKLDELGIADNTIVVFSSDNGPEDIHVLTTAHSGIGSAGPFRGRKRSLYEGGVRTPFIVRWPARTPANVVDERTVLSGVDFLQSIATLCGAKAPDNVPFAGEDMSAALTGSPRDRSKALYWERRFIVIGDPMHMSPMMAIREGRWKLLMNPDRSRIELYDIPNDPVEVDNTASDNPAIVEEMSRKLLAWHESLPKGPIEPRAGALSLPWPAALEE
ncbi:MAG: sulfatase-like hydrolase/transferase [Candidatus Hydrogenedentes bacterium]|nr:sulfatase-like hydrolase/transferase [Candidatus Hydrogenedentota bacterium]